MDRTRALLLLAGLAGCGGDDDGAECPSFTACGGDPAGEWSFEDSCIELDAEIVGCPGARLDYSGITVRGTLALEEDGTFSIEIALDGDVVSTFPTSCLEDGASCEDEVGTCSMSGSECRCSQPSGVMNSGDGIWNVVGTTITITGEFLLGATLDFCARGDELRLHVEGTDDEFRLSATYVLSRI